MNEVIKTLYACAFTLWNHFIDIAVNLFTTSPKSAADGRLYGVVHNVYSALVDCTIPLAMVFYIIAIYKSVIETPPEQQARRFMQDTLKFCLILYISANLWNVLGYIIDFSDGITASIVVNNRDCHIDYEDSELFNMIDSLSLHTESEILTDGFSATMSEFFDNIGGYLVFFLGGLISVLVMTACGVAVINVAFQRLIKPLVILPFSTIVMGIGACSGEGSRMMWHYGKTLLGFCISGAFMILAIKLGNILATTVVTALDGTGVFAQAIFITIQSNLTGLIVAGLCKSMDSTISKTFG